MPGSLRRVEDFISLWNELQRKRLDDSRFISNELRFLTNVEFSMALLQGNIERVKKLINRPFLHLDQQRITQLQKILETALELCKQVTFEEQERLCRCANQNLVEKNEDLG